MTRILLLLILCSLAISAEGATNYISGGTGSGAGSYASPYFPSQFPNGIVSLPGDVFIFTNTITTNINTTNGGTVGNPVIFRFASNACMSSPTLPSGTAWIQLSYTGNIVIDGGPNGYITLTSNGTTNPPNNNGFSGTPITNGTCTYGNTGIIGIGCYPLVSNITVENLIISNLYNRQTNTEVPIGAGGESIGIAAAVGGAGESPYNWTITNCILTGLQLCIEGAYDSGGYSNFTIIHNTLSNYNWGISHSAVTLGAKFYNTSFISNVFNRGSMFETSPTAGDVGFHRNDVLMDHNLSDNTNLFMPSNVIVAYNRFTVAPTATSQSINGGSGLLTYQDGACGYAKVYNNVFEVLYPMGVSGEGWAMNSGILVDNTYYSWITNAGSSLAGNFQWIGTSNVFSANNIVIGNDGFDVGVLMNTNTMSNMVVAYGLDNAMSYALISNNIWSGYNVYNGQAAGIGPSAFIVTISPLYSYGEPTYAVANATWAAAPLWYSNQLGAPLFVANTYIPATNDVVANAQGTNLYSLGITNDFASTPRPASGQWTVGAYQSQGTNTTFPPTVTGVIPNNGSTAGGTFVTITGTHYANGATVAFGANAATGVTVLNATTITCYSPAGVAGTVDTTVTAGGFTSPTSSADYFTYNAPAPPSTNGIQLIILQNH